VWTVQIEIFGYIEKPEVPPFSLVIFTGDVTEPPVFVAKKTVFFIYRLSLRYKANCEKCSQKHKQEKRNFSFVMYKKCSEFPFMHYCSL
jgi:hypothetical protein